MPQDAAPRGDTRFLWTGLGFAVLMLIGACTCTLLPLASKSSRLAPTLAFTPSLPAFGPVGMRPIRHPRSVPARAPGRHQMLPERVQPRHSISARMQQTDSSALRGTFDKSEGRLAKPMSEFPGTADLSWMHDFHPEPESEKNVPNSKIHEVWKQAAAQEKSAQQPAAGGDVGLIIAISTLLAASLTLGLAAIRKFLSHRQLGSESNAHPQLVSSPRVQMPHRAPVVMTITPTMPASQSRVGQQVAPSEADWNPEVKEDWTRAYDSVHRTPTSYEIEEIEGTIPSTLRGTIFRNGPGNFERGGKRFNHILDGDGLLLRWSIDGQSGVAHFARRLIETPEYKEEELADAVLHRNTFGTQPPGVLPNMFQVALKNPANTTVTCWGGKCLALWEAALPCRINPHTLAYEGVETFDGILPAGKLTVTTGLGDAVDQALGFGVAHTAHPREDRNQGRMVGWTWAAPFGGDGELAIKILEWDSKTGRLLHETAAALPCAVAPHDFAITKNWYIYVLNGMELDLPPFILGLSGPVDALQTTGEGVALTLIPRPDGNAAGQSPMTVQTDDPYFAIHHATACEELPVAEGAAPTLKLYTAAWPRVSKGPFLGDWGGDVPLFDDGQISTTQLLETTIQFADQGPSVERTAVVDGACIDHPHCDPRFDGTAQVRYIYMSYSHEGGVSGSPPIGWVRWDRQTGEKRLWRAPPRTFCEELVVIPRPRSDSDAESQVPTSDEADVWIAGMLFDGDTRRSSLAILDGDNIEAGPVCRLWLKDHTPWGLHGCFTPEVFSQSNMGIQQEPVSEDEPAS